MSPNRAAYSVEHTDILGDEQMPAESETVKECIYLAAASPLQHEKNNIILVNILH